METFWDTLGIHATTDTKKIRKAYSALVKIHNPEDDEEQFRKINAAYKAAMKFAGSFAHLNVSDEQIEITDVRPDGSFGVKFLDKDGNPLYPTPPKTTPDKDPAFDEKKEEEPEHVGDKLFDFDSIDSSVVKAMTYEEVTESAGMITFALGFAVPDTPKTREIKKFLDDNGIVKAMSLRAEPGKESEGAQEALRIAELFIDSGMSEEKVLWQFYFLSPLVMSLRAELDFFISLEELIRDSDLPAAHLYAIRDGCPSHPRIYKPDKSKKVQTLDFTSKVPFRYKKGKYPALEELMKNEKPADFKELTDFLTHVSVNLYGILMPKIVPVHNEALQEAVYAFNFILTSPECEKMRKKRILWRLYFKGPLVSRTLIWQGDFRAALTKHTADKDIPKDILKVIKKEAHVDGLWISWKLKEGSKIFYCLIFYPAGKNGFSEASPKQQLLIGIGGIAFALIMIIYILYMKTFVFGGV